MHSSQVLLPGMRALSRYHIEFKRATLNRLGIIAWQAPWGGTPVASFNVHMHSVKPYDCCTVGYSSSFDFNSNGLAYLTGQVSDVHFWYYEINADCVTFNYNGFNISRNIVTTDMSEFNAPCVLTVALSAFEVMLLVNGRSLHQALGPFPHPFDVTEIKHVVYMWDVAMQRSLRILEHRASVTYVTPVAREGYAHREHLLALNRASIHGGSLKRRLKFVDTVAEWKMHATYICHLHHFLSFVNVDNL